MYKLNEKALHKTEQDILDSLQEHIDKEPNFIAKVTKANSLWDGKKRFAEKDASI